jgi:dipeptidyl aminopeptidase/acylaminoacyl peptidase
MNAPLIKLGLLLCCALGFCADAVQADDAARANDVTSLHRAVAAQRALPAAPMLPRAAFRTRTGIRDIRLSPDGRWLAYLFADDRASSLWLLESATGQRRKLLTTTTAASTQWSSDSRTLVLVAGDRVATLAIAGGRPKLVMALSEHRQQEFLAVDPQRPRHFLIRDTDPGDHLHRFWRVAFDGRRELLFTGKQAVAGFAFDWQGKLAFVQVATDQENVILRRDQRVWKSFLRCGAVAECRLLSISPNGELLMVSDRDANFQRVVAVDPVSGKMRPLHSDPEKSADLLDVVIDTRSGLPRIASYFTDRRHNYGLDVATQRQVAEIERRFPSAEIEIAIGNDGAWLLTERGDRLQRARYHLYEPRQHRMTTILEDQQAASRKLPEAALAGKIAFNYRASDGLRVHGFLLLPPGRDVAKLPLIAMVHGGPYDQVRREFDSRLQFLANRGYAVFQPNFRASTGYGRAYEFAAKGDFGNGRVQTDILEGLDYLLAQGIGDPTRQAIEGHSFGGYSTLLALSHTPDRFRVGIAAAPSPDFGWTL